MKKEHLSIFFWDTASNCAILPAQVANHSTGLGSSCLLTELHAVLHTIHYGRKLGIEILLENDDMENV